jgi:hemerythrin-like domain-containing protein
LQLRVTCIKIKPVALCESLAIRRRQAMGHSSLQTIRDEHKTLTAMLRALGHMIDRGPGDTPERYFDVMRAALFYIDEFPERQHHPKESQLLFPQVLRLAPQCREVLERLEKEHAGSERAVRELQHLLLGWELVGDSRRQAFEHAARHYLDLYLRHMQTEEAQVLPVAEQVLTDADWLALDTAFATNSDPLSGKYPREPVYDRLFTRIAMESASH